MNLFRMSNIQDFSTKLIPTLVAMSNHGIVSFTEIQMCGPALYNI